MEFLTADIWSHILLHLNDQTKMILLMTSKENMTKMEPYVFFGEEIHIDKILQSYFFHRFTNLKVNKYLKYTDQNYGFDIVDILLKTVS